MNENSRYPLWNWEDAAVMAGLILPSLLVAGLVVRGAASIAPQAFSSEAMKRLPFQALVYVFLFGALWTLLKVRYGRPFWRSLAWEFPVPRAGLSVILGPVLALGLTTLGALLRAPIVPTPFDNLTQDAVSLALVIVFGTVLGPLCEELAFRGFLFPLVARALGPWLAIALTAALFAAMHGQQYRWSWQHLLLVGLAGAAFGWVRHRSGSTVAATLIHASYNLTFFILFLALRAV